MSDNDIELQLLMLTSLTFTYTQMMSENNLIGNGSIHLSMNYLVLNKTKRNE
jgi:hypothetical protein